VCLYCAKGNGEVWAGAGANLQVSQCVAGALNKCNGQQGLCARCVPSPGNPPTCIECQTREVAITQAAPMQASVKFQRYVNKLLWDAGPNFGKCIAGTGNQNAVGTYVTGNTNCLQFNPDNTCKLCKNWNEALLQSLVVPMNALFTNGVNPMSVCRTRIQIGQESRAAIGRNAITETLWVPTDCTEVNTAFRCARCKPTQALDFNAARNGYVCKSQTAQQRQQGRAANGCLANLAFQEYCSACNGAGTLCTRCVPGRSQAPAGYCSLNCKQLFGLTCSACNASTCTAVDSDFPNGRR